jgi:hypothetical protein
MRVVRPKTILINYVTWAPVGHAVEGLRYAFGYSVANPGCEVHLVLNSNTVVELARLCPWLAATYTVDIASGVSSVSEESFRHIPREWDYVLFHRKMVDADSAFGKHWALASRYFQARIASGYFLESSVPYDRDAPLRLSLPKESLSFAESHVGEEGVHIGVMPAGGGDPRYYPSLDSWSRIIEALKEQHPDATVHLFGKLGQTEHQHTTSISRADIDTLLERYSFCRDCFDLGLLNQLAVAQRCSLFVSPHTGFAFAVLAVGTPWLTISGGRWPEFFYIGVPFYSVLPDPGKYPAFDPGTFDRTVISADGNRRIVSMSDERIRDDLPEILDAARILIERTWTFEQCLEHRRRRWATLYYRQPRKWAALYVRPVAVRLARTFQRPRSSRG